MESLSTRSRSFSGRGRNVKRSSRWFGGLFWWTMLIILLALGAVASWTFCLFAFSYPEKPTNYWVLQKFGKLDPPKKFTSSDAPKNKSYDSRDLYDRFNEYEDRHFTEINAMLLRNYIENFERAEQKFTMNMVGQFEIEEHEDFSEKDLMTSGTVLMARCVDFPDVVIQYMLPGKPGSVPEDVLKIGDSLDLGTKVRSRFAPFNVILHITRLEGNQYCFCVVPIVFSNDQIARGVTLSLAPPERLNLEGQMPPLEFRVEEEEVEVEEGADADGSADDSGVEPVEE